MDTAPSGALSQTSGSPSPVTSPFEPRLADLGGDGALDVVVPSFSPAAMNVLLGDGTGQLRPMLSSPFPSPPTPSHESVADVNGDARPDVIVLEANAQNAVHVLLNRRALTADRTGADLGTADVGSSTSGTALTLTNASALSVRPSAANIVGGQGGDFALSEDTCADATLGPGATCRVGVRFVPAAAGPRSATLRITEGGDRIDVALGGAGRTPAPVTTTGPTTMTPTDTAAPTVTLGGLRASVTRSAFRRSGLKLTVTTNERATLTGVLFARLMRRGSTVAFAASVGALEIGSKRLAAGTGRRTLILKPSTSLARALRNRRLALTVKVTATDAAGNSRTASKSVRVR